MIILIAIIFTGLILIWLAWQIYHGVKDIYKAIFVLHGENMNIFKYLDIHERGEKSEDLIRKYNDMILGGKR